MNADQDPDTEIREDCEFDVEHNNSYPCHFCGGDGVVMGDELDDPLMFDACVAYRCPCCGGTGDAKDCSFW